MKLPVFFRIYLNDELVEVKQSAESQVIIGSGESSTIQLTEGNVSGIHCMIEERDNGYYVSDLGSETGIHIDAEKVLDVKIESGQELHVGDYKIEFFIGLPKPAAAPGSTETKATPPAATENELTSRKVELNVVKSEKPPAAEKKQKKAASKPKKPKPVEKAQLPTEVPEDVEQDSFDFSKPEVASFKPEKIKGVPFERKRTEYATQTYAPKSVNKDLGEILSPGSGDQVEVIVAWQERVIKTYIFKKNKSITVGSTGNADVFVPTIMSKTATPLITYKDSLIVHVPDACTGAVHSEKGSVSLAEIKAKTKATTGFNVVLQQNEMVLLKLDDGNIQVAIRFTKTSKKPIAAPFISLSPSELVSFIMAGIIAFMFSVYMFVYSPEIDEEAKIEDKIRFAKIALNPPKIYPPKPMKVAAAKASAPTQKKKAEQPKTKTRQGKTGQVAKGRKKSKTKKNKIGTTRPGGSKKTAKKSGGSVKSKRPDPTKSGLLGALTGGGVMDSIDQATSGSGELTGLANESTGSSGFSEDRAGEGIGLKGTGASGKGASQVGIENLGTRGRGTGILGSGSGGLGTKANTNISLDGEEAFFEGSIDRDAVRRVILQNKRSIRYCYNRALRGNSTVAGKLVLKWVVVERGRVQNVKTVSNSTRNKVIAKCVMNKIKGFRFPEPPSDQEYVVQYPFLFNSR